MKKIFRLTIFLLLTGLAILFTLRYMNAADTLLPLVRDGQNISYYNTSDQVMTPDPLDYEENDYELRATWVATVSNINMPIATSQAQYQTEFIDLIDRVKAANLNAIFFQTRPMNDAFYDSDYAPWSAYLSGTQGTALSWDAMAWMIEYAHAQGIEFHAWLNPYRVSSKTTSKATQLAALHNDNWAKQNPDMVIADTDGKLILNPGEPSVQTYLLNVVEELITKYDVDGIHFDDYFYSYSGTANNQDLTAFTNHNINGLDLDDWRRSNVDTMVESVHDLIEDENQIEGKKIKFGISPFGIWNNISSDPLGSNTNGLSSYSAQYADSRKWVKEGWLDYITPQLYWHFDHSVAKYADLIDWWADVVQGTGVDLIPGLGIYRAGNTATYPGYLADETAAQINYNSKHPEVKGAVLYSADYISGAAMAAITSDFWTTKPISTWEPRALPPQESAPLIELTRGTNSVFYRGTNNPVMTPDPTFYLEKDYEMRAIWVPTVWSLWAPQLSSTPTEAQYKAAFIDLIADVKSQNLNTIFFQVRGFNDAWYDSLYAPYSRYLNGSRGSDPGWDVMTWMVDYTHNQGIEFHAWLNPYRVTSGQGTSTVSKAAQLEGLDDLNWAKLNPSKVIADTNGYLILNPGEPSVRSYLYDVIDELVENYDIDGIHFDDYFYSYSGTPASEDLATFNAYNPNGLSLSDWRRSNIDQLIESVFNFVENENQMNSKSLKFGVSPFGVWDNKVSNALGSETNSMASYTAQYADSRKWVKEGWLHYITPQIYFSFQHSSAPYADVVTWWVDVVRGTGVDLIPGHSVSSGDSSWLSDEIAAQVNFNSQFPEIKGSVFYSSARINGTSISTLANLYWETPTLGVTKTYEIEPADYTVSGTKVGDVYLSDVELSFQTTEDIYYRLGTTGEWIYYDLPVTFVPNDEYIIYYQTIAENGDRSPITPLSFTIRKVNSIRPTININGEASGDNYIVGATATITASNHDIWIAVNHGNVGVWQLYTGPIALDDLEANGIYFIQTKTIDSEGTESDIVVKRVKVVADRFDDPIISIDGTGFNPVYQEATVSFTYTAPTMEYRINEGAWVTYVDPVVFNMEGSYTLEYRNIEANANLLSRTIEIDQSAPEVPDIQFDGDYDGTRFYTSEVVVTITVEVGTTVRYRYLLESSQFSSWLEYTQPITFKRNGTNRIYFEATDIAGNKSERGDQFFYIDIPPVEDNQFVIRNGVWTTYYGTGIPIELPTTYIENSQQVRGVWVATVSNIDVPQHVSEAQYKNMLLTMLDTLETNHINTMFFQVRPMNDAFYESEYAPWSRYIMGAEGQDPGWDILEFIIKEAHKRGIEFHAWMNPYRVSTATTSKASQLAALHNDNFAKKHPEWVVRDTEGHLILNPGVPEVRQYLNDVIEELMELYDVDGIHFDDYFYSYSGTNAVEDNTQFVAYNPENLSKDDWRRENINILVESVFDNVEDFNLQNGRHVKFGISPIGIWRNVGTDPLGSNTAGFQSYDTQYADTRKWVKEGWLHYILPQIYWEFTTSAAQYADVVDWWTETVEGTDVDLIIGHGYYRYSDGSWDNANELLEQIRYASKYDEIVGHTLFSYKTLLSQVPLALQALDRLNESYWTSSAGFPWETDVNYALFRGTEDVNLPLGKAFDPLDNVYATDIINGDITEDIVVLSTVDSDVLGTYTVTYSITGSDSKTTVISRKVHVVEKTATFIGADDISAIAKSSFDPLNGITAFDSVSGDITASISYSGAYDPDVAGTYTITYFVTGSDGETITAIRVITITAESVTIVGLNDMTIAMGSLFYPLYNVTAVDEDGIDLTSELNVSGTVNRIIAGEYILTYTVIDDDGNTISKSRVITVVAGTAEIFMTGRRDIFIDQGSTFNPLEGITATDTVSGDLTSSIIVSGEVDTQNPQTYTLVYLVEGSDGVTYMTFRRVTVEEVAEVIPLPDPSGCNSGCSSELSFVKIALWMSLLFTSLASLAFFFIRKRY